MKGNKPYKLVRSIMVLALLQVLPLTGHADRSTLQIDARNIRLNQANNSMTYSGGITLRQDDLTITGLQATARGRDSDSRHVDIVGEPVTANFIDQEGEKIRLSSSRLSYHSGTGVIQAQGNVTITTSDGVIQGAKASYDLATDLFSVEGNANASRVTAKLKVKNLP